ncbi:hypothetical protein SNEBB_003326 [Seison nebaliae]|nr:hypothetical protein SNEBB_003326 [Seison nebaliae]
MAMVSLKTFHKSLVRNVPSLFSPSASFTNLASYESGEGGRSSFNGRVATVFGATGFAGKYIVSRLLKKGTQVIIPYRGNPEDVRNLRPPSDLGQIIFLPFHLEDEESIYYAMKYSNVCINLIGREWETRNFGFTSVNEFGAGRIAQLAREANVDRLIHFSHLNASLKPQRAIYQYYRSRGSNYLISKKKGEILVKDKFPDATIFKPADIFGDDDHFIRYYCQTHWRRVHNDLPLYKLGMDTVKQPIFIRNVCDMIDYALDHPETKGESFALVGPERFLLNEIVRYMWEGTYRHTYGSIRNLDPYILLKVYLHSWMPHIKEFNIDKLEREFHNDENVDYLRTPMDCGIEMTKLYSVFDWLIRPFIANSYYSRKLNEIPPPAPLEPISTHQLLKY